MGNGKTLGDAVTNGTTALTSALAQVVPADTGKIIIVIGCGAGGTNQISTITYVNSTTVTLGTASTCSGSGKTIYWGTDDSTAIRLRSSAHPIFGSRQCKPPLFE